MLMPKKVFGPNPFPNQATTVTDYTAIKVIIKVIELKVYP